MFLNAAVFLVFDCSKVKCFWALPTFSIGCFLAFSSLTHPVPLSG